MALDQMAWRTEFRTGPTPRRVVGGDGGRNTTTLGDFWLAVGSRIASKLRGHALRTSVATPGCSKVARVHLRRSSPKRST